MKMDRVVFCVIVFGLAAGLSVCVGDTLGPEQALPGYGNTSAFDPAVAFGGNVYLAVWQAGRNENAKIVGVRISPAGTLLDAAPFVVSDAADTRSRATLAFGDGVFLVAWNDLRNGSDWDVYAARVSPSNGLLDADGILVAGGPLNQRDPAVAYDGEHFQLLWEHQLTVTRIEASNLKRGTAHIYGGRVSPSGVRLDGDGALIAAPVPETFTSPTIVSPGLVAAGGGRLLAGARSGSNRMAFWNMQTGVVLGNPVAADSSSVLSGPRFAAGGSNAAAVWSTFFVSSGRADGVRGTGLLFVPGGDVAQIESDALTREPGTSLSGDRQQVRNPAVAWDGNRYVAAWDITQQTSQGQRYDAVLMRVVSAAGEPQGSDVAVAGLHEAPAVSPAIASDGSGKTLIAYEKHPETADTPVRIAMRVFQ